MKHSVYLEKSQKPRVVVYDDNNNPIEMKIRTSTRPSIEEIERICKLRGTGSIKFTDVSEITVTKDTVVGSAELYYDDELVGYRSFPDLNMRSGDSLNLTYNLVIDNIPGHYMVK